MNEQEIKDKLTELALKRTTPFCYSCYEKCPSGTCKHCGSDDLMRHLEGVGVEYGTDWVIENILEEELEEADLSESFEQMIEECYGEEIQIGFIRTDIVTAMKTFDPLAWRLAESEFKNSLIDDGYLINLFSKLYKIEAVEELISSS